MFTKINSKTVPAAAARLLAAKLATAQQRNEVVNTADEVAAVYHTVTRETISLTELQTRHYGAIMAGYTDLVDLAKRELGIRIAKLKKDNVRSNELPQLDLSAILTTDQIKEMNACTELLVRALMPQIGHTAFQYAADFGSAGLAFSAAYRETVMAVTRFDPRPTLKNGKTVVPAIKLTAFVEERLKLRMRAQLRDEENNRKQQEVAALMMKYLAALELDVYVQHDAQAILEGIEYLHGGRHLTHRIVKGQKVEIILAEGEQYPLNPAFLEQSLNTVAKVELALEDVYQARNLSIDYSVNKELGTLGDTLTYGQDDAQDEVDMMTDLKNATWRLQDLGYTEDFIEHTRTIGIHTLIKGAYAAGENLREQLPVLAAELDLTTDQAYDLLKVWGPFYKKYAPKTDETNTPGTSAA